MPARTPSDTTPVPDGNGCSRTLTEPYSVPMSPVVSSVRRSDPLRACCAMNREERTMRNGMHGMNGLRAAIATALLLASTAAFAQTAASQAPKDKPWLDTTFSFQERAAALVS